MEVLSPAPTSPDFHFTISTTAPSSPRLSGEPFNYDLHYTSAPTSPTRAASIFSSFDNSDFAFDSGRLSVNKPLPEISTADELFHNGRIRPLHHLPPPPSVERGRKRGSFSTNTENRARASRSLSPLRDHSTASASALLPKSDSGSRKWRLKDLLLFRSVSEGRATGRESRDPLRNYTLFPSFFSSNSSSSSSSSPTSNKKGGREESGGAPVRRGGRRQVASAHEMHYTANRATAEELRKKTPLAYQRQGFFGFIQYNPAIRSITKGFSGNSSRT